MFNVVQVHDRAGIGRDHWLATLEGGRAVRAPFAAIIRVRAGRVAAVRLYLDTAALVAQLPAPSPA